MTAANNFITKYFQKLADERPRQYVGIWVTSWIIPVWSYSGIFWGWNVWVDTIYEIFYGDDPKTMGRGQVVYAFSLMVFISCWGLAYLSLGGFTRPGFEVNYLCGKTKRFLLAYYIVSLILAPLGLCVMALACIYKRIEVLYIGCILYGLSYVFVQPFGRAVSTIAYSNVGLRG